MRGAKRGAQVIHARSGVPHEIMGLMQGRVMGTTLVIMDSFALPVQGTETRVNAANEANEYMVEYIQGSEKVRGVPFLKDNLIEITLHRPKGKRTRSAGTTRIRGTAAGCLAST